MENIVWVIFGTIALLLAIGILLQLTEQNKGYQKMQINENAVKGFAQWCNYVCSSDVETKLTKEIEISSGSVVEAYEKNICIDFEKQHTCEYCNCDLNKFKLDLSTPEHLMAYDISHRFNCVFEKIDKEVVAIECKG